MPAGIETMSERFCAHARRLALAAGIGDDATFATALRAGGDVDELAEHVAADAAHLAGSSQVVQRAGFDPGSLPAPAQRPQRSMRSTSISRSVPKAASSKEISTSARRSWPRCASRPRRAVAPPKNASKMSPMPPKSLASKPRPKSKPLTPAWP